jgi:hypothetical protein
MKIGVLGTGMVDQPVVGRLGFEGDVALRLRDFITERGLVHGKCSRGDDRVTHEGGVGVPAGEKHARVIATGVSQVTNRPFNLIVAFERATDKHGNTLGRAVAESSFHHLVDYNWDTSKGCPSFLEEPPGNQIRNEPDKLADIKRYVRNAAIWLAPSR